MSRCMRPSPGSRSRRIRAATSRRRAAKRAHRMYRCCVCFAMATICAPCDRGQRYCGLLCRQQGRKQTVRAAGRRYQQGENGRQKHAARQRAYAARRRAARAQPEHDERGIQLPPMAAREQRPAPPRPKRFTAFRTAGRPPAREPTCCVCGSSSGGWARSAFIRRRGPRGP